MADQGYAYAEISQLLHVSEPFVSTWKKIFAERGVAGLRLAYRSGQPFLTSDQRTNVLAWIKAQPTCDLATLQAKVFRSVQCRWLEREERAGQQSEKKMIVWQPNGPR